MGKIAINPPEFLWSNKMPSYWVNETLTGKGCSNCWAFPRGMNSLLRVLVTVGKLVADVFFWITCLRFTAYFIVDIAFMEGEGRMGFIFAPEILSCLKT